MARQRGNGKDMPSGSRTALLREGSSGSRRGFAAMSPEKHRTIAAKGGRASRR